MQQAASIESVSSTRPKVSIILATYNEVGFIERCLNSILSQETSSPATGSFDIEVLVVDGMSNDGTRQVLERYAARDLRLRILNNEKRRTPFAFNLGLSHARGEFVCIFGAHSVYQHDYIAVCLEELVKRGAAGCGGRVVTVPSAATLNAALSAWTMSHPFGSSRKSFRTQSEGPVDTVNYPILRRDLVLLAGGYDEDLIRNQDNDLNQKLRAHGHMLWCTWKTQCLYFPKSSVAGLLRYAFTNGYWNVLSLKKNLASMAVRHFVPLAFVLCLLISCFIAAWGVVQQPAPHSFLALLPLCVLLGVHFGSGVVAALQVAHQHRSLGAFLLPPVFLGFHVAYGIGTLCGVAGWTLKRFEPMREPQRRSIPLGR